MSDEKKLELKRLIIFVVLAYGISWVPAILLNKLFGYNEWFGTYKMPLFALPVSYGPALANVITRKITKEGWHDSMLHLRLKGNLKYYFIAVLAVLAMGVTEEITATLVYGGGDFSNVGHKGSGAQIAGAILLILSSAPVMAFNTFGEEFGWRAYMNQKMEPLIGTTGTVVVGGIIWGLWHAELTVEGHNFGTDYPGYPYLGFLYMCVFCTFLGMGLMWLTKKTGSVYPAAIMHASVNFGVKSIGQLFMSGVPDGSIDNTGMAGSAIIQIPSLFICAIFMVLMLKDNRKAKSAAAA